MVSNLVTDQDKCSERKFNRNPNRKIAVFNRNFNGGEHRHRFGISRDTSLCVACWHPTDHTMQLDFRNPSLFGQSPPTVSALAPAAPVLRACVLAVPRYRPHPPRWDAPLHRLPTRQSADTRFQSATVLCRSVRHLFHLNMYRQKRIWTCSFVFLFAFWEARPFPHRRYLPHHPKEHFRPRLHLRDNQRHIPVKLKMSEIDLCCIIGNLFDNAIEASVKLPKDQRIIRVYMDMKGVQLYVSFTNFTASKKMKKVGGVFHSTKGDGHGFGLVRIDNIIERLNGYLSRNREDGAFTTEILIPQR